MEKYEGTKNMNYNPEKYWHERGANYVAPGEKAEEQEVENLFKVWAFFSLSIKSILEIGSGYGRIYKLFTKWGIQTPEHHPFIEYGKYAMCDFVESMRYKCLRNTDILPDYWDGNELPYNDNEFDFVISFSVLLHVTPDKIEQVLREHARVCRQYLFIATYLGGLDRLAPHCFEHDYIGLFEKLNLKIEDEKVFQAGLRVNWLLSK